MEEETQKPQENEIQGRIPKYSIILRFITSFQEIEVDDLILCQDKESGRYYYQIIDTQGRMWKNIPESDAIVIENLPTEKSIERFMEIKHQIIEMEKEKMTCKPQQREDVSIN